MAQPPVELGPFTYVSPEQERHFSPFLFIRQLAYGLTLLGVALVVLAFFLRWRWRRTPGSHSAPRQQLAILLETAKSLLARPANDFAWSPWKSAAEATAEMDALLATLERNELPDHARLTSLFEPNGHLQNLSVSSGWTPEFVPLAERFDRIATRLWPGANG